MEAHRTGQAGLPEWTYEADGRGQFHGHGGLAAHREVDFGLESGAFV
ncbi:hypothetical protein ACTU45_23250 [Streptomyces sp. 24-1644]